MKKQVQNILAGIIVSILIFVSLISVQVAYATDIPEEDVYYYEYYGYTLENGEATIISANQHNLNVTVPSEVDGYPVVAIAENAYDGVSLYGDITIPNSVRTIEPRAFAGATIRGNLYIFQGLEEIGEEAFKDAEIEKVYFAGTEEEFNKINIAAGNESILEAELNTKLDMSKEFFKSSLEAGTVGMSFFLICLLAPLAAPFIFLIIPPAGVAAAFAPAAGVIEVFANFGISFELFVESIAVLFM